MEEPVLRRRADKIDLSNLQTYRHCSSEGKKLMTYPRICIEGMKENRPVVKAEEVGMVRGDDGTECPVIRLSLKKPRNWNWKLTTSASSPAMFLPVIRLVDDNGNVLHDDLANRTNINKCSSSRRTRDVVEERPVRRSTSKSSQMESQESRSDCDDKPRTHRKGNCKYSRCENSSREAGFKSTGDVVVGAHDLLLGTNPPEMSSRDVTGKRGNKADGKDGSRGMHRQNRKLDSGYKSLRKTRDRSEDRREIVDVKCGASRVLSPRGRRSASEVESAVETCHRKKRHREVSIVGDRLLSVNGHDALYSDHAADLLRSSTDVVHLQLSRRRHDTASTSPRTSRRRRRQSPIDAMGANVSRHSEKGLSGRRTQSSGNLCNGNKQLARDVGRILTSCSNVGPKDRNKFCGSLPNHLDGDYGDNELDSECCNNNNGVAYLVPRMNGNVATCSTEDAALKNKKNGVELKLMPQQEALHDQGYGSERSPEDEHLPPLPEPDQFWSLAQNYPFITPDASFEVCLMKGNRGLGLSVTGGVDTEEQWPGLIRIKRLFPHQPAWQSGQLSPGDVLLATNGVALTGLTNYQALEVLRTTPNHVILAVCRPPSNVFSLPPPGEPPAPPRRDPALSISSSSRILVPLPLVINDEPYGEFDITLTKVNRSLGFTLRKEDESVLGHYVRALVREPALSDGRIRPGDKIVAVNDMPMSPLSHEEAVAFLRQCGDAVKLRLFRDAAQTPVAALSPTDEGPLKPKPMLRQEAKDMLTDLAVRKLSPGNSSGSSQGLLRRLSDDQSPAASPRRRRLTKTPSPDIQAVAQDRLGQRYLVPSPAGDSDHSRETSRSNTYVVVTGDSPGCSGSTDGDSKLQRPKFLDLCSDGDTLSPTLRKQKYMFANNESREDGAWALSGATEDLTAIGSLSESDIDGVMQLEPASLPPLSSTSTTSTAFSYRNPAYQSANPATSQPKKPDEEDRLSDPDIPCKVEEDGMRGLLKWKGVMFSQNNGDGGNDETNEETSTGNEDVLSVELNRGWNSRLGFSLQGDGRHTFISAIYSDSVAAKDGRLRANDQLITVNDENVQDMSTADIIDLLRKIRGTIGIRVLRKRGPKPQIS